MYILLIIHLFLITYARSVGWKLIASLSIPFGMSLDHVSRVRRLYKIIFRLHRGLPAELRVLGDNYARDEFKRHIKCTPHEANIFLKEWTDYALNLAKQMKPLQTAKKKVVGEYLDPQMLDYMTDEQLAQLYELHKAASLQDPQNVDRVTSTNSENSNNR